MTTDRDTVTKFLSLASSNRVGASEIEAGIDTLQAVIDFCQRLQRQFASARTQGDHSFDVITDDWAGFKYRAVRFERERRDEADIEVLRQGLYAAFQRIADLSGRVSDLEARVGERGAAWTHRKAVAGSTSWRRCEKKILAAFKALGLSEAQARDPTFPILGEGAPPMPKPHAEGYRVFQSFRAGDRQHFRGDFLTAAEALALRPELRDSYLKPALLPHGWKPRHKVLMRRSKTFCYAAYIFPSGCLRGTRAARCCSEYIEDHDVAHAATSAPGAG